MLTPQQPTICSQFEDNIDVFIRRKYVLDALELAEVYGFSFSFLQATHDLYNICIHFEKKYAERISDFIDDINTIKNK